MKMNIHTLIKATKQIDDLRRQWGNLRHKLSDVLVIAFCAIICGAQAYDDLADVLHRFRGQCQEDRPAGIIFFADFGGGYAICFAFSSAAKISL